MELDINKTAICACSTVLYMYITVCLCTNKYVQPGVYYGMLWIEWVHLEFFYLH